MSLSASMKVLRRMDGCPRIGLSTPFGSTWFLLFVILLLSEVLAEDANGNLCIFNGQPVPRDFYDHYTGYGCYESSTETEESTSKTIYLCQTDTGLKVPCLKEADTFLDFGSEASRVEIIKRTRNVKLKTCLENIMKCDENAIDGLLPDPELDQRVRIWSPGSVAICDTEARSKFHIAMLSISFILGVPASILISYFLWNEKNAVMSLHRNLIIGLTFRSLMTMLIQTELILPQIQHNPVNEYGLPALATFETLANTLVLNFWALLASYIWKFLATEFKMLPVLTIYIYISIGVSITFTIIWAIVVGSTQGLTGWVGIRMWHQWINEPIRIIFLASQIYLTSYVTWRIFKDKKNDGGEIGRGVRRENLCILLLTPIFLLQFCLNAGTPDGLYCEEAYFYTLYFIDGIQGALVCIVFFYLDSTVQSQIAELFGIAKPAKPAEKSITTLGSLVDKATADNDIVYSSVVTPDRFEKTLGLYKKHNVAPKVSVTLVDGEAFKTCHNDVDRKMSSVSEYFDIESLNEFHDANSYDKLKVAQRNSDESFKSINERPETPKPKEEEPKTVEVQPTEQKESSESIPKTVDYKPKESNEPIPKTVDYKPKKQQITPVHKSKYAVEDDSSSTDSENDERNKEKESDSETDSSSITSMVSEKHLEFLKVKHRPERYSVEVNRGSTSDDSNHKNGLRGLDLYMQKKALELEESLKGKTNETYPRQTTAPKDKVNIGTGDDTNVVRISLESKSSTESEEEKDQRYKHAIVKIMSARSESLQDIPSVVVTPALESRESISSDSSDQGSVKMMTRVMTSSEDSSTTDSSEDVMQIKELKTVESQEPQPSKEEEDFVNYKSNLDRIVNRRQFRQFSADVKETAPSRPVSEESRNQDRISLENTSDPKAHEADLTRSHDEEVSSEDDTLKVKNQPPKIEHYEIQSHGTPEMSSNELSIEPEKNDINDNETSSDLLTPNIQEVDTETSENVYARGPDSIENENQQSGNPISVVIHSPEKDPNESLENRSFSGEDEEYKLSDNSEKSSGKGVLVNIPSLQFEDPTSSVPSSSLVSEDNKVPELPHSPPPDTPEFTITMPPLYKPKTLPSIYSDLSRAPLRPKTANQSAEIKRQNFSKMFATHRDSILSSSSAMQSGPVPSLRKYKGTDSLNESDKDLSLISKSESEVSDTDSSDLTEIEIRPRQVISHADESDWSPQRISFTNN